MAEEIGRNPALEGTTVIMLSSMDVTREVSRLSNAGVAGYLVKPVALSSLLDTIVAHLGGAPASHMADAIAAPASTPRPRTVLLVDDNAINRRVASGHLHARGHQVTEAVDGLSALEALAAGAFDVVLMDVQMPGMDGFEATARIRAQEAGTGRHQRVVAMTAHAMAGDRERCLDAGMDAYVAKPIARQELFAAVEFTADARSIAAPEIGLSPAAHEVAAAVVEAPWSALAPGLHAHAPVFDPRALLTRFGGDEDLMREVIEMFRGSAAEMLDDIRRAAAANDTGAVERAAHAIKGSLGELCAGEAQSLARDLEHAGREGRGGEITARLGALEGSVAELLVALEHHQQQQGVGS